MTLDIGAAGTNFWNVNANGFWDIAGNWSLGHVPTGSETVVIDRPVGTFTVTVRTPSPPGVAGPQAAARLQMDGDENLTLLSDLLTLAGGPSNINGVLTLQGGTLTTNGALTANTLNLSGGTLNGTGNLTISNSYTHTSGTISLGGPVVITQTLGNLVFGGAVTASAITARGVGGISNTGALTTTGGKLLLSAGDAAAGTPDPAAALTVGAPLVSGGGDITLQSTGNGRRYGGRRAQCGRGHRAYPVRRRRFHA